MFLELRTVSPKTPADGMLEIAPRTAERVRALADPITVVVNGTRGRATVESLNCTCEKAEATGEHVHWFLRSDLLKRLTAEREVAIDLLEDAATVLVADRTIGSASRRRERSSS